MKTGSVAATVVRSLRGEAVDEFGLGAALCFDEFPQVEVHRLQRDRRDEGTGPVRKEDRLFKPPGLAFHLDFFARDFGQIRIEHQDLVQMRVCVEALVASSDQVRVVGFEQRVLPAVWVNEAQPLESANLVKSILTICVTSTLTL